MEKIEINNKPDYGLVIIKTMFTMAILVYAGYCIFPSHTVSNWSTVIGTLIVFVVLNNKHKEELEKTEQEQFKLSLAKHNDIIHKCISGDYKESEKLVESGVLCDQFLLIYPDKRFFMEILYNLKISSVINIMNHNKKLRASVKNIILDDFEKRLHYRIFLDKRTIVELVKKNVLHEILRNKVRRGI